MNEIPLYDWIGFHVFLLLLFVGEFLMLRRKQTPARAIWATCMWVGAALAFAGYVWYTLGTPYDIEFISGYAIEESLSVDNLFVFLLLFREFHIEGAHQRRVLFWGILGAVVMRAGFIGLGIELLEHFAWVTYIFGAFLLFAAVRLLMPHGEKKPGKPAWTKWIERIIPVSSNQSRFFLHEQGKLHLTMLSLALIAIAFTDFVFALDSIPAVLSITRHPFIAYSSNVMAVMGLRSLYFLLAHLLERLAYLHYGLAAVLGFAAFKMLAASWIEVSALVSLAIILSLLGITVVISLLLPKKHATA